MFPDEIGSVPPEDHDATAPAPDSIPTPAPEQPGTAPAAAPVTPPPFGPQPQYAPPAPQYTAPNPGAPAPQYAPPTPGTTPQPQYAPPAPGTPTPQYAPASQYAPTYTGTPDNPLGDAKNLSIAGMILGICSIPFCWLIIPGIVGLILSIQGKKKTPQGVVNNYAKAGKICSIIGLIIGVLVICAYVAFIIYLVSKGSNYNYNNSYSF